VGERGGVIKHTSTHPPTPPTILCLSPFTMGARQLVVHDAAVTTGSSPSYASWLTPYTTLSTGAPSFSSIGADTTTAFAPASSAGCSAARVRNLPEHSRTMSMPRSAMGSYRERRDSKGGGAVVC